MYANYKKHRMEILTASEVNVLDALLAVYPDYAMVDNYIAVNKLLREEMIEADVRREGSVDQAVYRITTKGADAYGSIGVADKLERVG